MNRNPEYYSDFKKYLKGRPQYHMGQIMKDIDRTFSGRFYTPEDEELSAIKNVLEAYAWRNPWVGYC